jgi:hypothetical protein
MGNGLPGIAQSKKVENRAANGPVGTGRDTGIVGSRYFNKVARYRLNIHPFCIPPCREMGGFAKTFGKSQET